MVRDEETHSGFETVEADPLVTVGGLCHELLDLVLVHAVVGHVRWGVTGVGGERVLLGEVWSDHSHTWEDTQPGRTMYGKMRWGGNYPSKTKTVSFTLIGLITWPKQLQNKTPGPVLLGVA